MRNAFAQSYLLGDVADVADGANFGSNRIRFKSPKIAGSDLRIGDARPPLRHFQRNGGECD